MKAVAAVYRVLLLAYPADFRRRFGAAMEQALRDRYRAAASRGAAAIACLLVRTPFDVLINAAALRIPSLERTPMNWQSLSADTRYALRLFRRGPLFTLLAVGALALGIGANTAIFTIVNAVLVQPLPYHDERGLVAVWSTNESEHRDKDVVAPLDFLDYRRAGAFSDLEAAYSFIVGAALTTPAGTEQMAVTAVTPGMLGMLGRTPVLGRLFTDDDAATGVVISHRFWQTRLGADPNVLGRVLTIADQPRTVLGVMPDDFVFPYKGMLGPTGFLRSLDVDGWLPLQFVNGNSRATGVASLTRRARFLSVIGRLKPGVTPAQAGDELAGIARQLAASHPDTNAAVGVRVVPLHDQVVGDVRPALFLLVGGVGFVLLMACVNLANLLLARSAVRRREMAIRAALGAGRRRLVAQTLVETTLLAMGGGIVALLLVYWTIGALVALAPPDMPRMAAARPDGIVLVFTFALAVITGLAIGVVPALAASRPAIQSALKESGRGTTSGRGQRRVRGALVIAEVALAVVLTLGTGLLVRSFVSVLSVDPGFAPERLLTMQIALPDTYHTPEARVALYARLFEQLDAIPGVRTVGGTTRLPLGSTNVTTKLGIEGRDVPAGRLPEVEFRRAVGDYFEAMGIPLLRGRGFNAGDGPAAPSVAVINQTLARTLFPGEDPIGRRVVIGGPPAGAAGTPTDWTTIVGVIGDVRHAALEDAPAPELYIWYLQGPPTNPFIVLRTEGEAGAMTSAVREAVRAVDKTISAYDIRPMLQVRAESVGQRRFVLLLVAAFGALALIMAAVGVYGVMGLIVSERTPEIGIRLALGAARGQVLRSVVGQGVGLAAAGIAAGLLAAAAITPLLRTQLFGVGPLDPATMTAVPAVLLVIAALACFVPARRAMTIDPVSALRNP